ncbi:O-methyltransferase [Halomonas sp. KM-1]|uniref:O-methyltransferase n=1 Tax=Halomonas sp. KM-1 TaxID=590061 RepID=UPI000683E717|nr:O-methyltransferase [Halomonas sp. KM-1]
MSSFNMVNYSLRPSKSIQRQIIFEGVRFLQGHLNLDELVYIGLGSIWFSDFIIAHKLLRVNDMVSIEASEIGYHRAKFNSPYATVRVFKGLTNQVLPTLYEDDLIKGRPWFVWLDYDMEFNESLQEDLRSLVEKAPANSIVIITFNGHESNYGAAPDRPQRLRELFGASVPDDLTKRSCKGPRMQETLADYSLKFIKAIAADISRPGGFLPSFRIIYKDSAPMITVGGILPSKGAVITAEGVLSGESWECNIQQPVIAPNLTLRETSLLQSQLPCQGTLTREMVRELGFDLEEEQIRTFQSYYRQFPSFAQIMS